MDHRNPDEYAFDGYLEALGADWLAADPLLTRWLARSQLADADRAAVASFGRRAATRYRVVSDVVEQRENLPRLSARDPYDRGEIDVVLPAETWQALGEVHGSGIWRASFDERARYAIVYLLNQNGEFGVTCSTACTDGMARALRALTDDARSREVIDRLEHATPDDWIHGAQFVTEIQGGSDAALNAVRAEEVDDGLYALTGAKWFCSNLTADYWMVTARHPGGEGGHRGVGLFCVPRLVDGRANGHAILRLKDKLGTRALPTAELRLEGALGWPVGDLDAGLKNMVAVVLTTSRVHNVVAAAAMTRRAAREARAYAEFRRAFGERLIDHPLLAASIERVERRADLAAAGAFETVDTWVDAMAHEGDRARAVWARVLISLSKAVATRQAPGTIYEAMMAFGGNGIEERFCAMPRLWRDAAIMETWEGPYTLLLMNALGDLVRFEIAGREEALLRPALGDHLTDEDLSELRAILAAPTERPSIERWGVLAPKLYAAFERSALDRLS